MEINKYTDIIGVQTNEDITEGRMVVVGANSNSTYDFGSRGDLMGVSLPADSTEAASAKYVLAHAVDNRSTPFFDPTPSFEWSLRQGGWDQAENAPISTTVHLTHKGNKVGLAVLSGALALAFDRGVFTVPSGAYVYSADIETAGNTLAVSNTADHGTDSGKLRYDASGTIAIVERYNSTTGALTFRTL